MSLTMPCNYKDYPPNWKTEIRPTILARANNCCEFCGVKNGIYVFRGMMDMREVYQNSNGEIRDANTGEFIERNFYALIEGKTLNQKAIKIVLTIMHLNNDTKDNRPENLKAGCQRCHNRYDAAYRKKNAAKTRHVKSRQIAMPL